MAEFYNPSERGNSNSAVAQSIKSDQSKSGIQPAIHDEDEDETKRRIREIIRAIEETNDEPAAVHAAISASRDPDERNKLIAEAERLNEVLQLLEDELDRIGSHNI